MRNPDYFVKDRPYLDGYKFFISTETSVRAAAIRSRRAYIEFRDLPLSEVDAIEKQSTHRDPGVGHHAVGAPLTAASGSVPMVISAGDDFASR